MKKYRRRNLINIIRYILKYKEDIIYYRPTCPQDMFNLFIIF